MRVLALLICSIGLVSATSPVERVITLLEGLKRTCLADGDKEQKIHDQQACWEEKTMKRKSDDIESAKATLSQLEEDINQEAAKLAHQTAQEKQLIADIAENEKSVAQATSLRNKEHSDFQSMKDKAHETLDALGRAREALSGAGMKKGSLLSVISDVRTALSTGIVSQSSMTTMERKQFNAWMSQPSLIQQAGVEDYAPQSSGIQGILKNMFENSASDLESASSEEATSQTDHQNLMEQKTQEHTELSARLQTASLAKTTAQQALSKNKSQRTAISEQLELDEEFLANTKADSVKNAMIWSTRTRLRTEEISGINEAIEILQSGGSTFGLPDDNDTPPNDKFLQLSAFKSLSHVAIRTHSHRVAKLASKVHSASGHFDVIIESINHEISALQAEEASDISERDQCQEEGALNSGREESLAAERHKLEQRKKELYSQTKRLEEEVVVRHHNIHEEEKAQESLLDVRNQQRESYKATRKDNQKAIKLLREAIKTLMRFYKNNKLTTSLLQAPPSETQPEYTIDQDKGPQGLDANYGGRKGETRGVISLLKIILDETRNDLKKADEEEAANRAEFEQATAESRAIVQQQEQDLLDLKGQLAATANESSDTGLELDTNANEHDAVQKTIGTWDKSCAWVETNFASRREKRKQEIEGLHTAKAQLAAHGAEMKAKTNEMRNDESQFSLE